MINKYRLTSPAFEREKEEDKISPKKVYFIAVEGNITEVEYFDMINQHREELGIHSLITIEPLKRSNKDTNSDPMHVISLLEEYLSDRGKSDEDFEKEIAQLTNNKFSLKTIRALISNSSNLTDKEQIQLSSFLQNIGYDLAYKKYLSQYDNEYDEFCVVVDRDQYCHTEQSLLTCLKHCMQNNYRFLITNPCFEFWLLLHVCDIKAEYKNNLSDIKENIKISNSHTYISKELSNRVGHGKRIKRYASTYLEHIHDAIKRAKDFKTNPKDIIYDIGTNLGEFIDEIISYKI